MWYDEQDGTQIIWENCMTVLNICLFICIIAVLVCLISIWHSMKHFHKVYYRLSSEKISKPVKFVLLSDLHDKEYGESNNKLLQAIDEEAPDAVLIAGDMLTAHPLKDGSYRDVSLKLMRRLSEKYPVFYGMGNHERKMDWNRKCFGAQYEAFMKELEATGVTVLKDSFKTLEKWNIRMYGLDLEYAYYKRSGTIPMEAGCLSKKLGNADQTYYNIVLAHNPAYFEQYATWNPDLVLSGHVHGGLVRIPFLGGVISPSLKLFPKYDGGHYTLNGSNLILSRGLGYHSIEFRMWNPAELVVITLEPK